MHTSINIYVYMDMDIDMDTDINIDIGIDIDMDISYAFPHSDQTSVSTNISSDMLIPLIRSQLVFTISHGLLLDLVKTTWCQWTSGSPGEHDSAHISPFLG